VDPLVEPADADLATDGPGVILAAVDDSVTALRAAAYAVGLARRQHARLVALYVLPVASLAMASAHGAPIMAAERAMHGQVARELAGQAGAKASEFGVPLQFVTASGDAYREITRVAAEIRPDAIVVAAGRPPADGFPRRAAGPRGQVAGHGGALT
jgi:nucleotide-binding universal stress UspA family protein